MLMCKAGTLSHSTYTTQRERFIIRNNKYNTYNRLLNVKETSNIYLKCIKNSLWLGPPLMHVTSTFKCRLQLCLCFSALTCCPSSRRSCSRSQTLSAKKERWRERTNENTRHRESTRMFGIVAACNNTYTYWDRKRKEMSAMPANSNPRLTPSRGLGSFVFCFHAA